MVQFINLTPAMITLLDGENNILLQIEPSGWEIRVSTKNDQYGEADGIKLTKTNFGRLELVKVDSNIEEMSLNIPGAIYIMSELAHTAFKNTFIWNYPFNIDLRCCEYTTPVEPCWAKNEPIIGFKSLGV
jgi:hypothetical protein